MDVDDFLTVLIEAVDRVEEPYFTWVEQFAQRAGDHSRRNVRYRDGIRFGERSFCYELYYQLKTSLVGTEGLALPPQAIIQGEVIKRHIADPTLLPTGIRPLGRQYCPDLTLHTPGNFENQEVVIEVKANPRLTSSMIISDLRKLDLFIGNYAFQLGIFLAVNVKMDELQRKLQSNLIRNRVMALQHKSKIVVMCKEAPRIPLAFAKVPDLVGAYYTSSDTAHAVGVSTRPQDARPRDVNPVLPKTKSS